MEERLQRMMLELEALRRENEALKQKDMGFGGGRVRD